MYVDKKNNTEKLRDKETTQDDWQLVTFFRLRFQVRFKFVRVASTVFRI